MCLRTFSTGWHLLLFFLSRMLSFLRKPHCETFLRKPPATRTLTLPLFSPSPSLSLSPPYRPLSLHALLPTAASPLLSSLPPPLPTIRNPHPLPRYPDPAR